MMGPYEALKKAQSVSN